VIGVCILNSAFRIIFLSEVIIETKKIIKFAAIAVAIALIVLVTVIAPQTIITILLTIFVIGLFVLVHELGHYAAARKFGVTIKEFAVGMGPKIFTRVSPKTGIRYSLRALPIGGYVTMVGEDETSNDPNALTKKPVWQRMVIMASGAVMNILFAAIIMFVFVTTSGDFRGLTIEEFRAEHTEWASSGLSVGDTITHVNGRRVRTFLEMHYTIMRDGGESVEISIIRRGEQLPHPITVVFPLRPLYEYDNDKSYTYDTSDINDINVTYDRENVYVINRNIGFRPNFESRNIGNIFRQTYRHTRLMMRAFFDSIGDMISGNVGLDDISGPVGIGTAVGESARAGLPNFLWLCALISFNIGLFNLIPFPALDGGRLIFLAIEGIRRKPMNPDVEGLIHFAGIILLLILMVVISFGDVVNLTRR
jgi:regulator of sigma E protease